MEDLGGYLQLLGATLLVEALVTALAAGYGSRRFAIATSVCGNLLTHPAAWLLLAALRASAVPFVLVEVAVTAAEAALQRGVAGLSWKRAVLVSVAANGATALGSLAFSGGRVVLS